RGLSLRSHLCAAVVYSDWVLLSRILRNFLSNALRYSEHGRLLPVSYTHLTLPTNEQQCRSRWAPGH
ncbi:hypothetical protein, partial [Aquitalea sp. ASV15]|uniref:hypothetical protein n=1 Tax=Aquitalea sp. ASV15 TaxID=2795104 RepID=UPI001E6315DA